MGLEEEEDWEALDVDDSDLSSFLRPCKRPHSKTLTPIPGPAGAVQAAMNHRKSCPSSEKVLATQDFIRQVVQNGHQSDHDFNTNPWLSALQFLPRLGMEDATPLSSIKKGINVGRRVPKVVAIIKSCTPNGFGDMMVTLKDPTATIAANVHRKVFSDGQFRKDITVGSVLVLQKVAVSLFSPARSTCYLNITLHNIVKVFSKDSAPPSEQFYSGLSDRCTTPSIAERHQKSRMLGNTVSLSRERTEGIMTNLNLYSRFSAERHENSLMPGNASSLPQERTEDIMTNLKKDSRFREVAGDDKEMEENLALTSYHSDNRNDRNQNTVLDRENLSLREDSSRPLELTCGGELQSETKEQPNPPKLGEADHLAWSSQGNRSPTNSFDISDAQETGVKNHLEKNKEIINPISSIPHWTEEQLDELLAFD